MKSHTPLACATILAARSTPFLTQVVALPSGDNFSFPEPVQMGTGFPDREIKKTRKGP